jgi:S-DNA-T family DNA segregation ATPase FtsK/SpoIIIE
MKILGPTRFHRLNEAGGLVFLFTGLFLILCLISYHPQDPSWNSVTGAAHAHNLTAWPDRISPICVSNCWASAHSACRCCCGRWPGWMRSDAIPAATSRSSAPWRCSSASPPRFPSGPIWHPWNGAFSAGGVIGILIADSLLSSLNLMGTVLLTGICLILSLYLISKFSMATAAKWLAGPLSLIGRVYGRWANWRSERMTLARERAQHNVLPEEPSALYPNPRSRRFRSTNRSRWKWPLA